MESGYSIGQLAREFDVTARAIRFYEGEVSQLKLLIEKIDARRTRLLRQRAELAVALRECPRVASTGSRIWSG